jgi:hypothetical protein
MTPIQDLTIIAALHEADAARVAYVHAGYHGTDSYVDALERLTIAVRANLSVDKARERACGYAAGREDASGVKTTPAPNSWRGDDSGWLDYADAFAQAQADFTQGRRGMMTNCKAAYERWTATGGRTVHDTIEVTRHGE